MKSNHLTSTKVNWESSLSELFRSKRSKTNEKLLKVGFNKLQDLLWLLPLRIQVVPPQKSFQEAQEGRYFSGKGEILSIDTKPNFRARGKRGIPLQNITVIVKDFFSPQVLNLKWFNAYPSLKKSFEKSKFLKFNGEIQSFQGQRQIITPNYSVLDEISYYRDFDQNEMAETLLIQYPTTNGVSSREIKKLIDRIPIELWDNIPEIIPSSIIEKRGFLSRQNTFKVIHGKVENWSESLKDQAIERLKYEEFYIEQMMVLSRRKNHINTTTSSPITLSKEAWKKLAKIFPYELTKDQLNTIEDIKADFNSGKLMMRLLQGDVGCGKTSIAIIAALACIKEGFQVAFMCPTESLAFQHYRTITTLLKEHGFEVTLLLGGQSQKEKKNIYEKIQSGKSQLIIGTHSLFQKSVNYLNLKLAIIDEQHKFGVNQRLELIKKGKTVHCLIMTATPIPRSLSLTQYGDLDISTIKNMPSNRKTIKTRIVTQENYHKFLSFLKTRVSMGEQAYIVVPAIADSPTLDMRSLEEVTDKYTHYFPEYSLASLHGRMSSEEKDQTLNSFENGRIQILISTSVVEVGINVLNATIIAVLSPERFGLSSLHQLRGRVGRGKLAGFCFLVLNRQVSPESLHRLSIIEKNLDGFTIAEEDLKIRGEGNLFGKEQSGRDISRKISSIIADYKILENVRKDLDTIQNDTLFKKVFKRYTLDEVTSTTI